MTHRSYVRVQVMDVACVVLVALLMVAVSGVGPEWVTGVVAVGVVPFCVLAVVVIVFCALCMIGLARDAARGDAQLERSAREGS